jgi:uncharacterized Zn finger protein
VYYLLGEEFDRDPFLIFKLRGTSREAFLESLDRVSQTNRASSPVTVKLGRSVTPAPLEPEIANRCGAASVRMRLAVQ